MYVGVNDVMMAGPSADLAVCALAGDISRMFRRMAL